LYVSVLNSFADTLWVTADNACGSSLPFPVLLSPALPNPGFSPTTVSVNLATTLLPVVLTGTHYWTFQNGSPASSTSSSPLVSWSQSGVVSVFHRITDANGCVDSLQQNLTVVNCLPLGNTAVDFNYSGNVQSWTVPAGVCSLQIECWGGQGGTATNNSGCILGGLGGYAKGIWPLIQVKHCTSMLVVRAVLPTLQVGTEGEAAAISLPHAPQGVGEAMFA
jgi:hypothetical protein